MEKAVAYLRVSSKKQSLKRQEQDIETFAKSKKVKLVKVFKDVISATKKNRGDRDGFNEMDNFIYNNKDIKHLLVIEISRLGRQQLEVLKTIDEYYKQGINIHIKHLDLSTLDNNGQKNYVSGMVISLLARMAENEVEILSDRIKSGKAEKARQGVSFNAKITGYKKDEFGKPIIDDDKAPIVKKIFDLASKDIGMRSISDVILDEFGEIFPMGTIGGIIRNRFYKGEREGKNKNIKIEALVSEELWEKANASVESRKNFTSRRYVHPNIVQGKIFCGICGNPMYQVVIINANNNRYSCKDPKCSNSINRPWLQEVIKQVIETYASKTKDKVIRNQIKEEIKVINSRINNIIKFIDKEKSIKTNLTLSYASGDIEKDDYKDAIKIVANKIPNLESDLRFFKRQNDNLKLTLNSSIEHFSKDLKVLKKQIKHILKSVIVFKNEIEINLTFASIITNKPNSTKLGWLTRKFKKNKNYGNLIINAYLVNEKELENLEIMVNSLDADNTVVEKYFNSEEYKNKMKGVKSLGGKKT